jgi:formiminotetrahydrofolate cyclodeaminase
VRLAAGVHASRTASPVAAAMRAVVERAQRLEQQLHHAASDDATAWQGVVQARRGRSSATSADAHAHAVDEALLVASAVPMRIATLATEVLSLAADAARTGDDVTAPDAWTGATIAHACTSAALGLLRGNLAMLTNVDLAAAPLREASTLQERAAELLATARIAVRHVAG